ncbi:gamma-glutamylcyclotransferase [Nocardia sp. 2]|uniref:Putative gamma-glutamylcyclotransferase n=1 Tax=Nocardia acididurans TaxID=2802282 RepID=A0ABS1MEA1_9NOCA|nr:gamma-glutamylcyclotransferase family protein [Nocardia acididurans]MBL1078980.1 gamma-glutamylcyclotransferase [Nocardia acididurans]
MSAARRWGRRRLLPAAGDPLFVYGTLQYPEVLNELIGRTPELEPAQVSGRRAAALPDRVYPGLVTATGAVTHGFLLRGLTAGEWQVLDAFEDDEYDLTPVSAHAGECEVYAWTYTWKAEALEQDWSVPVFTADHLPYYAAKCAAWRRELVLLTGTV